jgi:dihydroneopterin aldolase
VTSYADLKNEITDFVSSSKYKTLEKLISELQKVILKKFPIEIQLLEINKIVIAKKYNAQKVSISI